MSVIFNNDSKFDFQLKRARGDEHALAHVLLDGKIEHKCERNDPWRTGNLCIETAWNGKPSGIRTTEASLWAHELKWGEQTIVTLLFPVPVLRRLVDHYENDLFPGHNAFKHGGDLNLSEGVLLPIGPLRLWGELASE